MKFILPLRSLLSSTPIGYSKTPPESDGPVRESKDAAARLFDDGWAGPGGAAHRNGAGRPGYPRTSGPALFRRTQVRRHGRRQDQGHGSPATGSGRVHGGRRRGGVPSSRRLSFGHREPEGQRHLPLRIGYEFVGGAPGGGGARQCAAADAPGQFARRAGERLLGALAERRGGGSGGRGIGRRAPAGQRFRAGGEGGGAAQRRAGGRGGGRGGRRWRPPRGPFGGG